MKNKINCNFSIRESGSIAVQIDSIFNGEAYCGLNKNKIVETYKLNSLDMSNRNELDRLTDAIQQVNDTQKRQINNLCVQLQEKWNEYYDEYISAIEDTLRVGIHESFMSIECQLHLLPINEIDFEKQTIYLNCDKDVNELFKNYIIMLTKLLLVNYWKDLHNCNFYSSYQPQNKVWLFTEIAIDAIFANSQLNKLTANPSYKYFYSLKIDLLQNK